jgi:acyl transferase domain-containing protein
MGEQVGLPQRGISSFGFSGTNAHIVVEEYLPVTNDARTTVPVTTSTPILFVLSAKSEERLKRYAENIKYWLESNGDVDLADMAYTLQTGREAMEFRLAFPGRKTP